jgi:beta-phosphoglucomutase-like phosphatase (HAD superfamily)
LEDSNSGALSAISAGMKTIVIPDLLELTDEVISLSLDVVPSLAEVKHIIECLMKASGHSTVRS